MMGITGIAGRIMLIAAALALVASVLYLKEIPIGFTFATQGVNLKIDSKGTYNGQPVPQSTWTLKDLTPGVDASPELIVEVGSAAGAVDPSDPLSFKWARSTPKPMMRRVNTSMTNMTQWLRSRID